MKLMKIFSSEKPIWKPNRWQIIAGFLIIAAGGVAWFFVSGSSPISGFSNATPTPSFQTSTVRRGDLTISASGQGTLTSGKYVDLSFLTSGMVAALNVKAGDVVTAGQELAKLDNVKSLEAEVASNNLLLLQAQKTLDDLQTNKDVSLAQSYQDYLTAEQKYNEALRMTQRDLYARCSKEVNAKNLLALDKAKSNLDLIERRYYGSEGWINAKSVYDQALANYNYCISYTPEEKVNYQASLDVAKVTLDQADAKYKVLEAASGIDPNELALAEAQVKKAAAQLDLSEKNLAGSTIVAPISGTVTYLAANQGAMVEGAVKFITISDLTQPTLDISIDETDLEKLVIGGIAEVNFDAIPEQIFTGKIIQIDPQLTKSGQVQVATAIVQLDSKAGEVLKTMPLGLQASVTIIDKQVKNALLVPVSAIRDIGDGQMAVFVVNSSGNLKLQLVKVGLMDTARAEIITGLNEGDTVSTGLSTSKN